MSLDYISAAGGTNLPTLTRDDGGTAVEVPEGVVSYDDGSQQPVRVSAAAGLPVQSATGATFSVTAAALGAVADAAVTDPSGSASAVALLKGLLTAAVDVWDQANDRLDVSLATRLESDIDSVTAVLGDETEAAVAGTGRATVGTTAAQLTASSVPAAKGVAVKAAASNTGTVYVGKDNTVTADGGDATSGYPLAAGESVTLPVSDANVVWLVADAASQKAFFVAV